MPREILVFTGDRPGRGGRRPWGYTVSLSVVTHSALIVLGVGVPLLMSDALPTPASVLVFAAPAPAPVHPVVQPALVHPTTNAATQTFASFPTSVPDGFATEPPPAMSASPGGVLERVLGGPGEGPTLGGPPPAVPTRPLGPSGPLRVGGDIKAPRKVQDAAPAYPAIARIARVQGTVLIEATIAKDGGVRNVRVVGRPQVLDEAALTAVRQWRYTPTLLNGEPVEVIMTVTVQFMLEAK